LSVGIWRTNGNPPPCTDIGKILHTHPHLPKKVFGKVFTLPATPLPLGLRGQKPLKLKETFLNPVCKAKDQIAKTVKVSLNLDPT